MEWEIKQGQPWPYGVSVYQNHLNLAFRLPEAKQFGRNGQKIKCSDEKKLEIKIYSLSEIHS